MPCRIDGMEEDHRKEMFNRLELATRVACAALSFIEEKKLRSQFEPVNKEASVWWAEHKAADMKRKKEELKKKYEQDVRQATAKVNMAIESGKGVAEARQHLNKVLDAYKG